MSGTESISIRSRGKPHPLTKTDMLEPDWPAVVAMKPCLSVRQTARHAALALGRVGTVEEGDVLVSDIPEP